MCSTISSTPGSALTADYAGLVLVNATVGNISITLPAAAAMTGVSGRILFIRTDATTNTVSISPNGSDTFNSGAQAGARLDRAARFLDLASDGSAHWVSRQKAPNGQQEFNTPGSSTFTVPLFVTEIWVEGWGGGAGGSGNAANTIGSAGASGAYGLKHITGLTPGATITVTIASAASGGAVGGNDGANGGTCSFGPYLTVLGGSGGP
jgi:hypothetical protein